MNKILTLALATAASLGTLGIGGAVMAQDGPARAADMTRTDVQARAAAQFARMDANADGVIDGADRETRARARFDRMDANGDNVLSFEETRAARDTMRERRAEAGEREGRRGQRMARHGAMRSAMMGRADTDNDGIISETEFTSVALARFERADANSDGIVTAEERREQRHQRRDERSQNRG